MGAVNSLICWGGLTGKTVSISATTDAVTLTKHGLRNGTKLWPSGTLPAELSVLVPVHARSTGTDTFTLHTSAAGAIANTGQILFAGSSTYAAVVLKSDLVAAPATALSAYGLSDLSRWDGSRIYDGLLSWMAGRTGASALNEEVLELGEAFTDTIPNTDYSTNLTIPAAKVSIAPTINGIFTPAFHGGVVGAGYVVSNLRNNGLTIYSYNTTVFGFTWLASADSPGNQIYELVDGSAVISHMIIRGTSNTGTGVSMNTPITVQYCKFLDLNVGVQPVDYIKGARVLNNTITKCNFGVRGQFGTTTNMYGFWYNNISVGNNTANWFVPTTATIEGADKNAGLSGEALVTGSGTRLTIATSDFANHGANDFRPAAAGSPQVDTGVTYYGISDRDNAYKEVPNYNNGGFEAADVGADEFDHGFGNHPATATIALTSIVSGSQVRITKASDGTVLYNNAPGASLNLSTPFIGDFNVLVRKASASPYYREFQASGTTVANQTTTIKCLQQLDE